MENSMKSPSRRQLLKAAGASLLTALVPDSASAASHVSPEPMGERPQPADRRFRSEIVEQYIADIRGRIGDPELARLFFNCFPNTLDTTVEPGTFEGNPDTAVITGDIPAFCPGMALPGASPERRTPEVAH